MRRAALLCVAMALAQVAASQEVRLQADGPRKVILSGLPAIPAEERVARQLETGLTTTFAFRIELKDQPTLGGARVDVRYHLWDEVFQVAAVGIDGQGERQALANEEELVRWWQGLHLVVLDLGDRPVGRDTMLSVVLTVVPFSASELDDTQRWFSRSFGLAEQGESGGMSGAAESRSGSLEQLLGVLMATSIQRRPLTTYRWILQLGRR